MTRTFQEQLPILSRLGDILGNSIVVNELESRQENVQESYALFGYAIDEADNGFLVRSIVNKYYNEIEEIDIYNLYAAKGAKKDPHSALKGSAAFGTMPGSLGLSNISIRDFLENVKDDSLFSTTASQDVLNKLGVERKQGSITKDLKYSLKEELSAETKPIFTDNKLSKIKSDNFARKNVPGYSELAESKKMEVRWGITSGMQSGVSENEIANLANIVANTNVAVAFSKSIKGHGIMYANGKQRAIYLNPDSKKNIETTLLHELTHSLKGTGAYIELETLALKSISAEKKKNIEAEYRAFYEENNLEYSDTVLNDEVTAFYVENALADRRILEKFVNSHNVESQNLLQRAINWLNEFKSKKNSDSKVSDKVAKIESLFFEMLNEGKANSGNINARFSIDNMTKDRYNKYGWALAKLLKTGSKGVASERTIFISKVDSIMHQSYHYARDNNGNYVIPVTNKLVITDVEGDFPTIHQVIELTHEDSYEMGVAREDIIAYIYGGNTIEEYIQDERLVEQASHIGIYTKEDMRSFREYKDESRVRGLSVADDERGTGRRANVPKSSKNAREISKDTRHSIIGRDKVTTENESSQLNIQGLLKGKATLCVDRFQGNVSFERMDGDKLKARIFASLKAFSYLAMQYGEFMKVISPLSLREDIANKVNKMKEKYLV